MAKKRINRSRRKEKDFDVNIKINNLEKAVKAGMKSKKKCHCNGSGFWVFGSALAMILSYAQNSSILWAILHGIISWIYVIYRIIVLYA